MPGQTIGEVSVKVRPDTTGFSQELKAQLSKLKDDFKVDVGLDTKKASAEFKALKTKIQSDDINAQVKLKVNRSELDRVSKTITNSMGGFGGGGGRGGGGNMFSRMFSKMFSSATKAAKGLVTLSKGFGDVIKSGSQAGEMASSVSGGFTKMGQGLAQSAAGIISMVPQLAMASVLIAAIAGTVAIIGGLAVAAVGGMVAGFAGLPVVLALAGAGFAAVKLGMDGIKAAAKTLQPEVDRLKQKLSDTFEKGLTPVFNQLKAVFPALEAGLTGIAEKLVVAAQGVANMVTSASGLENIKNAFSGMQEAMTRMGPGLGELLQALLNIAGTAPLYTVLGDTIGSISSKFAAFFEQLRTGAEGHATLTTALTVMKGVLDSLVDTLTSVALAAYDFFVAAGPGITAFFQSLANTFGSLDWAGLGKTFGDMFFKMAEAINAIPQESLDGLVTAIGNIATKVGEFADSGGFTAIIDGLTILTDVISGFMDIATMIIGWLSDFTYNIATLGTMMGIPGAAALKMQLDVERGFGGAKESVSSSSGSIMGMVSEMAGRVTGDSANMANNLGNNAQRGATAAKDRMRDGMNGMTGEVANGAQRSGQEAGRIPGIVQSAMGGLGGMLVSSGKSLIQGFVSGIRSMIGAVTSAASSVVSAARAFFPFSPAKKGPFSGKGYTTHSGKALMTDWAAGIEKAAPAAISAVENTANRMQSAMNGNFGGTISADSYGNITADLALAMSGMAFTIDENGGKVLAKVINKTNTRNARR